MKTTWLQKLIILSAAILMTGISEVTAQPNPKPESGEDVSKAKPDVTKHIKVLGDETHVSSIIASPRNYMYKTIVVVGGVKTDNYFNYRYSEDSHSFYSLRFQEFTEDMKPIGNLTVYASRGFAKPLIDDVLKNEEKGIGKLVRLKIQITSKSFREDDNYFCENAELIDWQFTNPSHDSWTPWAMEGAAIEAGKAWAEQAAILRAAQEKANAEAKAKAAAQKQAAAARALQANQDAAAKDDMFGLLRMGERYRAGDGVEKDLGKAREYLQKAADAGSPTAKEELSKLEAK